MVIAARILFDVIFVALIFLFQYLTNAPFWGLWAFMMLVLLVSTLQDLVIADAKAYEERNK